MNILAHGYLSNRNEELIVGNFIADFVKGDPAHPRHGLLPGEIAGIRLHRAIDTFTDSHPAVADVRELLYPRCHKYAGVAVDVFFDHFLAVRFAELTGEPLHLFVPYFYHVLTRHTRRFPASAARMLEAMIRYDWLTHYQTAKGIDRTLNGLSRRTAFPSGLDTVIIDFERHYTTIGRAFDEFWPQLVSHCRQTLMEISLQ